MPRTGRALPKWKVGLLSSLLALAMLLPGCGGGGDNGSSPTPTTVSGVSSGTITQKGSIFVNGTEFDTQGATLVMDGSISTIDTNDSVLKVGMQVEVQGDFSDQGLTGKAKQIKVKNMVLGAIDEVQALDTTVKSLQVLGQTVLVDSASTRLGGSLTFAALAAGPVVKVHGLPRADGTILASYLEQMSTDLATFLDDPTHFLEVKGPVSNLSGATFNIYGLTVDASGINSLPAGLANGVTVEVKGRSYEPATTTLRASSVEVLSAGLSLNDAEKAQVEGYITALDTASKTLVVEGQTVHYANAVLVGGVEADLGTDVKIEAEGALVNGILEATKVLFKDGVRVEANIANINTNTNTFTLEGLPGIVFTVQDGITEYLHVGGLETLKVGDAVKVRARVSGTALLVTRVDLEADSPATQVSLRGPVGSFDAAAERVTIVGFTVDTSTIPDANFKINDASVGSTVFFSTLKAGMFVKVSGQLDTGTSTISWREIVIDE